MAARESAVERMRCREGGREGIIAGYRGDDELDRINNKA